MSEKTEETGEPSSSPAAPPAREGLIGLMARNHVAATLLMILFLIGGAMTLAGMRSEVFPDFSTGLIQVEVPYPGATPAEVEDGITRRVEEAILGTDGVDKVTSTAYEDRAIVAVELEDFADPQKAKDDIETAIDSLSDFPPAEAEAPRIAVVDPVSQVVSLVVRGVATERQLREVGEELERDLLGLPDVSTVRLRGARDYEISIEVSEPALRAYGLSLGDVAAAVRRASLDLSAGTIRTEGGQFLLRAPSKARTGEEFERIVVLARPDGTILRLKDVATVRDGFEDQNLVSEFNGAPAIFVDVMRSGETDILDVRNEVLDFLATYQPPQGIEVTAIRDQTDILRDRISLLGRNAILGFALVFLLLVLTLDLRIAFWVAMGVPISFLGGFLFFGSGGLSINMVTLFGLIIVIGIVVDDAIVVGENIYATQERGLHGVNGATKGALEMFSPVLVGVLTTMVAFAPIIFVGGNFGKILQPVPIVVISVLAVSLIEAFFILPSHLSREGRWSAGALLRLQTVIGRGVVGFSHKVVEPLAAWAARWRYAVLAGAVGIVMITGGLLGGGVVRLIFFPFVEGTELTANLTMPDGTSFQTTSKAADQLLQAAEELRRQVDAERQGSSIFRSISLSVGGQASSAGGPGMSDKFTVASNLAQIQIELTPARERDLSAAELERRWRLIAGDIPGAEELVFSASLGPQFDDIAFELAHEDNQVLIQAVNELRREISRLEGVARTDDSYDLGKRELVFRLTPAGLAAGLQPEDLARTVRRSYFGEEVQRIQRGRDEVKVYVRYPKERRETLQSLQELRIALPGGGEAPLGVVAEMTEDRGVSSIKRVDGQRVISVTGDVDEALATPGDVNAKIEADILPDIVQRYPGLDWSVVGGQEQQSEDLESLQKGFVLAMIVIYAMLATVLKSYLQPVIILASIPLGFTGAVFGHLIMNYDLSFVSLLGCVALAGVVINSSVVLVDRYNQLRDEMDDVDAIVEATRSRFRPIALTTVSTALGLAPIISETSPQAQFLIPMAISLAFGLVIASILMLAVLPAVTMIVRDVRRLGRKA